MFLYDSIFVPVDSVVNKDPIVEEFSISVIRRLGLIGWDVIQVVPKTIGIALTNMNNTSLFGEEWGGGSGGNVAGVYFIVKKAVMLADISGDANDELGNFISQHMADFLPQ